MKKKIYIFITLALLTLAILPIINIHQNIVRDKKKTLYSVDYLLPYINHFFYFYGISTEPSQVIIGKNNWLYLVNTHATTDTPSDTNAKDLLDAQNIGLATRAWEQWFRSKGIRNYKVIIGPDKNTIYPEYLPNGILPDVNSVTNNLLAYDKTGRYVDTRSALKAAKTEFNTPLYYQTDSHWNNLGAWIAFRAFTNALAAEESLQFLSDKDIHILNITERSGGDLANILRLNRFLVEHEVNVKIDTPSVIETEQYDFETNVLNSSGDNPPIRARRHPLLVKSKNALNKKKVLWLRDSFGMAMSPYMAATFTQTLQIHYRVVDPALLTKLVESFKPDYVFVTVVERSSREDFFMTLPPPSVTSKSAGVVEIRYYKGRANVLN